MLKVLILNLRNYKKNMLKLKRNSFETLTLNTNSNTGNKENIITSIYVQRKLKNIHLGFQKIA